MKEFLYNIVRFFMRLIFGQFQFVPVNTRQDLVVEPRQSILVPLVKLRKAKFAKYVAFVPRKVATGLLFHVGLDDHRYSSVKAYNLSKNRVRIKVDTHIGYIVHIY